MWHSLMTYWHSLWQKADVWWLLVGYLGQIIFAGRFIVQWWVSEKAGRSVMPYSFWTMSIVGTVLVFVYACYKHDPVFILAYSLNVFIYIRNLMLIHRHRAVVAAQAAAGENPSPPT
jgi:lipid-A-disaccharide synthase-like uncharacterized protein